MKDQKDLREEERTDQKVVKVETRLPRTRHSPFAVATHMPPASSSCSAHTTLLASPSAIVKRLMPLSSMAFTLPWILDEVHPALAEHALIPLPLKALNRLFWERTYARLSAPLHLA